MTDIKTFIKPSQFYVHLVISSLLCHMLFAVGEFMIYFLLFHACKTAVLEDAFVILFSQSIGVLVHAHYYSGPHCVCSIKLKNLKF
jgi:hypothetical protein